MTKHPRPGARRRLSLAVAMTILFELAVATQSAALPMDHLCPEALPPGAAWHPCVGTNNNNNQNNENNNNDTNPDPEPDPEEVLTGCDLAFYRQGDNTLGWRVASDVFIDAYLARGNEPPRRHEVLWVRACDPVNGTPCIGQDPFDATNTCWEWYVQNLINAQPPAVMTPEQVRDEFWLCAEVWISPPQVQAWPPEGTHAVVNIPTFVSVENWPPVSDTGNGPVCDDLSMTDFTMNTETGEFSVNPCLGNVCVSITGVPELTFDPGDGSEPIDCQPPTLSYDPAGDPTAQAQQANACSHEYTQRTSGSPYQATVQVDWVVEWSTPTGSGTFDSPPDEITTYTFSRQVDEVQSVVSDVDLG